MRYGNSQVIDIVPTIDATPYTSGDVVGGKLTLGALKTQFQYGVLKDILVVDKANQKQPLTFLFFSDDPSAGTYTNNSAAPTIPSADALKCIAKVNVAATDYETVGTRAFANVEVSKVIRTTQDTARNLYCVVVTTGTPTYAVGDLMFRFGLLND